MSFTSPRVLRAFLFVVLTVLAGAGIWRLRLLSISTRGPDRTHEPDIPQRKLGMGVKGALVVSLYAADGNRIEQEPRRHISIYRNGLDGYRMEDNDIRGFLDGNYKYGGSNQPTQIHVRVGRRPHRPTYGETELFRVLQRWDPLDLPPRARITEARLELFVEPGPGSDSAINVKLYEVRKDWNPGRGGMEENNSPPARVGEVWWNDIGYGVESWALPGVGFSSDDHPDADTGAMPLAEAAYAPGDERLVLRSDRLAAYIGGQVAADDPLLFLLKASDYDEDVIGHLVHFYSANHGDDRNLARRPRLVIEWESPAEVETLTWDVAVEYGRSYPLPRITVGSGQRLAATFVASPESLEPTIEARGGNGDQSTEWAVQRGRIDPSWEWLQLRVLAAHDPLVLGEAFEASLRDTWVISGPPEDQEVPWTFLSPTGRRHEVPAEYVGSHEWQVRFEPDELGPWRYYWTQAFILEPYRSAVGDFDVIGGSLDNVLLQLRELDRRMQELTGRQMQAQRPSLMAQFSRLERAAMQHMTPEAFASSTGRALRRALNRVRETLSGGPVPQPDRWEPEYPPDWASDLEDQSRATDSIP